MKLFEYFKDVKTELGKVTWPTRAETWRMTVVVLGVSIFVGVYIGSLDFGFTNILGIILK